MIFNQLLLHRLCQGGYNLHYPLLAGLRQNYAADFTRIHQRGVAMSQEEVFTFWDRFIVFSKKLFFFYIGFG